MSIYNTLRSMPSKVSEMLVNRGFVRELTTEERTQMDANINALVEEWFGAASTVVVSQVEKKEKKSKTKAAVVAVAPEVIDKVYLETLTVSALKDLGKDCAAMKGRKPRDKLIELLLEHLAVPSPVAITPTDNAEESAEESGSDEELRAEVLPPAPIVEGKKEKAPKEKKPKEEKAPKEKKPKQEKAKKEPKKKEKAETEESEDENTVELRTWYHPNELSKPLEERTKYFIDPKTNELYHPDRLTDGNAEWHWNEETLEIVPIGKS